MEAEEVGMSMGETTTTRLRLTLAYDGAPFSGWQSQANGNTIQDLLIRAGEKICGRRLLFQGSGRTDAGVHATGQVAHVDIPQPSNMGASEWQAALNSKLPPSIRVVSATACQRSFHAQHSALEKSYRYRIAQGPVLMPQLHQRAWHLYDEFDLHVMQDAATLLEGYHDFFCFSVSRGKDSQGRSQDPDDTRRTLSSVILTRHSLAEHADTSVIDLEFTGNGFLYKMVRMLTGAIVRAGQGRTDLHDIETMLADPTGEKWHFSAPADGLTLIRVTYPLDF